LDLSVYTIYFWI